VSEETRRVTIVAGPPAAGKSTWVKKQTQSGDLVIEWEAIVQSLTGEPERIQNAETRELVGAMREAAIEKLAEQVENGKAPRTWVIIGAPSIGERQELAKRLNAEVVVVLCSLAEGRTRIEADASRPAEQMAALDRWWDAYAAQPGETIVRTDELETSRDVSDLSDAKAIPEDRRPPAAAREEAQRGLEWRREYGRGGTEIGVARARDIANGRNLSVETLRRMVSYFARHEVDKEGQGWNRDEPGYPSAGRIAWALWGGDPARSWATALLAQADEGEKRIGRGTRSRVMLHKSATARFEVKDATDAAPAGEVVALVSVFNNVDLVGDRVMPGAFSKSLAAIKDAGRAIPFIWSHNWGDPNAYIGKVTDAEETADGLLVKAELFDTPTAQHIRTLLASGVVSEFSFAYDVIDQREGKDGVTELTEVNILEAGPTLKGANPATQLVGVRSLEGARAAKAEPGELVEGSFVTWGVDSYGRVEYVMTEGFFGVDNDPLSLQASPEDPLALVRLYDEEDEDYLPTENFQGFRFSELTLVEEKSAVVGKRAPGGTPHKVGRALSTKNEDRLRKSKELLDEVLASIDTVGEPAKTEEPEEVKVEERGMPGEVAALLIVLEEIDE
jgi:HK97 family phage prohead protease